MDVKIKTALISVSDKTGVADFAQTLAEMGVKIISTGGTAKALAEAGVDVTPIEKVTGQDVASQDSRRIACASRQG